MSGISVNNGRLERDRNVGIYPLAGFAGGRASSRNNANGATVLISVVIPTINEAHRLPRLLTELAHQGVANEPIVVDGGSVDETVTLARRLGANVLRVSGGRGAQLRAGARAARGEALLFLHADSVLPTGGLAAVERALASAETIGGNFRLVFDGTDDFSRRLTRFYGWLRRRAIYYGDSGVFVRREAYHMMGGLRGIALMEDYDFIRRMEAFGRTCCIEEPPLITSSRRFKNRRPVRIVFGWLAIHALYHLGTSPDRLARLYRSVMH